MLEAFDIRKKYNSQTEVLRGVSLQLNPGEVTALVGSSGAGKTTLLQILGTLDRPSSGEVRFENRSLSKLSVKELARFRNRHLGFVFQFHNLLPEFSALENVAMPAYLAGITPKKAHTHAGELLERLGLGHRLQHKPGEMSGGEQQRAAVARSLMNKPKFILADEPTGNLDSQNTEGIMKLFFELAKEHQIGFLVATHNERFASAADRCIRITDGKLE